MAFDPLSWAIGYALKHSGDWLLGKTFNENLPRQLQKVVYQWSINLPENIYVFHEAVFPEVQNHAEIGSALYLLRSTLQKEQIPTISMWFEALRENRRFIAKGKNPDDLQPYFTAEESIVETHIMELAQKIHRVCQQDEKLFRTTIDNKITTLSNNLEQMRSELIDKINLINTDNKITIGFSTSESTELEVLMPEDFKDSGIDKVIREFGVQTKIRYISADKVQDEFEPKFFNKNLRVRPLHIGLGIGGHDILSGVTISAFVELSNGEPGILMPHHLFSYRNNPFDTNFRKEMPVYQPMSLEGKNNSEDIVAYLWDMREEYDSAVARLKYGTGYLGNIVPRGYGFPFEGEKIWPIPKNIDLLSLGKISVFKIGARTGFSEGKLATIAINNLTVKVNYRDTTFNNVFLVESPYENKFSEIGDSGSLVFASIENNIYALGFIFASGASINSKGEKSYESLCLSINDVLSAYENLTWLN
ncbi:MAG: hypothetical protein AB4372_17435 [Xenococcus sp. (in: cyanobacteria)]